MVYSADEDKAITSLATSIQQMSDWDNIIILSADALRADHLSFHGYHRKTSPVLDNLATESLQFRNAYSASSHTREAIPSLLTGHYPDEAIDVNYYLDSETVASTLSANGFSTAGFHSNPFVSRAYGFDQGFDAFDDDLHLGQHKLLALAQRALDKLRGRHYARAKEINERSLNWIDSLDGEPFFLWNHYMDTHGPYEPPKEYQALFCNDPSTSGRELRSLYQRAIDDPDSLSAEDRQLLVDCYDGEIRYNDEKIGEFLDALQERDLLERSLLVFTADHGDAFGEHGYYEHPRYLHDELIHVPLLIRIPGGDSNTVATPVSTLDIVPTILSGIGANEPSLPGDPLTGLSDDDTADRVVFSSARGEDEHTHLRRFSARSTTGTWYAEYDHDVGELQTDEASLPKEFRDHISERLRDNVIRNEERNDVNDEIADRLDALGYK